MRTRLSALLRLLVLCAVLLLPPAVHARQPASVTLVTTAVSGAFAGIWTAVEAGYFADDGVNLQLVSLADSSRAIPALLSREAQFATLDGQVLVQANASGADLRAVASVTNRFVFSVVTSPDIMMPQDLQGKRLGISGFGSANETAARQALASWGLSAGSDVALVPTGSMPGVLAALSTGQIDGGVVSPPTSVLATRAGYRELIDLSQSGPEWPSVTLSTTRGFIADDPDTVARVVHAYSRGLHRFRTDQAFGQDVLGKYLGLTDQAVLEETWRRFRDSLDDVPHVTAAGMRAAIDSVAASTPSLDPSPESYLDDRFVQPLGDASAQPPQVAVVAGA